MRDEYLGLFNQNLDYFTILLDKSQDVFWITNSDYSVQLYISPAFERIWGYEARVLYEKPLFWLDTIVDEDRLNLASVSKLPHSCVQSCYQENYRIIRSDGEIRWIQDHTYPIYNQVGQCTGYAGIAKDITNTLKLEQELQIANKFLPKLAEKMERSAFWVRDSSLMKQLYLSKGFEKIWGRPVDYFYAHPEKWIETLLPEEQGRDVVSRITALDQKGELAKHSDLYQILRPDGETRWIKDVSFPIFDDKSGVCIGFAGIADDVTEEKLYSIELQQAKERAEAANIAKSNFIASISHDFRTPLNGLLGMAEILRSGRCYPEQKEYIDAILQAGNTLLDLVEDIINFVALDLNKLPVSEVLFNLEKLIEEIILAVSPQAHEKKVQVIFNFADNVPKEIYGDINRIKRILMNLVNNAVKFTIKGHVLINVELQKQSKKKLWLQFMIEDTGIGISSENFEYIFGSFNRIDPSYRRRYKGTGLGLTIVKQFLNDLGGKIKVNSQLNQGSVFYCQIPFKLGQNNVLPKASDHYSHVKTLIVDDNKKRAITFIKQFGFKDADITSSKNVIEQVRESTAGSQPYHLIIIDDEVKVDIKELAQTIKEFSSSALLLITHPDSSECLHVLKKAGYSDVINKPIQPLVVVKILESAVAVYECISSVSQVHSVLLIEDDALTQKITRWMLEELNCTVETAGTGMQALELLENNYDLIVMDVGLPDMDGIQLAQRIRTSKPNHEKTPIVALTAHVLEKDKEQCLAAGMNDFLKKPLFKKDLKKLLSKIF